MIRTSLWIIWLEPTGSYSFSCSTRSNLLCRGKGMSPISSRNKVPPSAICNLPGRPLRSAPVKAPGAVPKNSASSRVSGIAALLMLTNALCARGEAAWMAWASSSLPVPVSPSSNTGESLLAPRRARRLTSRLAALVPMNWAKLYLAWRARSNERVEASSCCMLA
ncbi:hypothetical protein D3C84_882040 [compost metagenome]